MNLSCLSLLILWYTKNTRNTKLYHKKHETLIAIPPIYVYIITRNNRLIFKIKNGYKLELQAGCIILPSDPHRTTPTHTDPRWPSKRSHRPTPTHKKVIPTPANPHQPINIHANPHQPINQHEPPSTIYFMSFWQKSESLSIFFHKN